MACVAGLKTQSSREFGECEIGAGSYCNLLRYRLLPVTAQNSAGGQASHIEGDLLSIWRNEINIWGVPKEVLTL